MCFKDCKLVLRTVNMFSGLHHTGNTHLYIYIYIFLDFRCRYVLRTASRRMHVDIFSRL